MDGAQPGKKASPERRLARETRRRKALQTEIKKAHRDLELRTAELEAAQTRVAELERRLHLIHRSPPYRLVSRLWRVRARGPLARLRRGAPQPEPEQADEGAYTYADFRSTVEPSSSDRVEPAADDGSAGDGEAAPRAGETSQTRPLRAVRLLGEMTTGRLVRILDDLSKRGFAENELLVITDCDALRSVEQYGYRYEYLPPRGDWERRLGRAAEDYDDFVRRRLAAIASAHGVVPADPDELIAAT